MHTNLHSPTVQNQVELHIKNQDYLQRLKEINQK